MRVRVLEDKCQGHTLCNGVAPSLFLLRVDDGHAYVEQESVTGELAELARRAALGCPERAILVEDDGDGRDDGEGGG
jgi:ferredoxin